MNKYIEGRKKYYSKYFEELYNPIFENDVNYFKYNGIDIYIESKGFENDVFYIKKKLFRYFLDKKLESTGQNSIFFEIYTKKQLLQSIQIIKDYEKSLSENKGANSKPTR